MIVARRGSSNLPWIEAIKVVLREAGGALHYSEIADRIQAKELRSEFGATPAQTVNANLSMSIANGDDLFRRVGRGEYALTERLFEQQVTGRVPVAEEKEESTGAIRAFGMYWRRNQVIWEGSGLLTGRQSENSDPVNFAEQIGVYLLHDRDRVVYVGRALDALYSRIFAHTRDRLEGRWDRFSWFGLRNVQADGSLTVAETSWNSATVVETMEALLIECIEPVQNRRRGDRFNAIEYLQVPDERKQKKRYDLLSQIAKLTE